MPAISRLLTAAALVLTMALAPVHSARADDELYKAFGGKTGIDVLVDKFVDAMLADARVKDTFKDSNIKRVRKQIKSQFCVLAGGPCVYEGRDMVETHKKLAIDEAQMNAVVEDLQEVMSGLNIPFRTQNRLVVLLAPMKRDIVTR